MSETFTGLVNIQDSGGNVDRINLDGNTADITAGGNARDPGNPAHANTADADEVATP